LQLLTEAARVDPAHPVVCGRLCESYQLTEEFDKAIAACRRNIELRGDGQDYNSLGQAYMSMRDYPNAALAFEQAVKKSSEAILYGNYLWALESAHLYDKAIPAAEKWAELSEHDRTELTSALENLTAIWTKLGRMDKAKAALAKLYAIDPQSNFQICELKTNDKGDVGVNCSFSSQHP